MNKNILILCYFSNLKGDITSQLLNPKNYPPLASVRLQILPALRASIELGYKPKAFSVQTNSCIDQETSEQTNLCLLGPTLPTPKHQENIFLQHINAIKKLKKFNSKIAAIYADNHIGSKSRTDYFYQNILKDCDYAIAPTSRLQEILSQLNLGPYISYQIPDPWQIPEEISFNKDKSEYSKILWFGNAANLTYLDNWLKTFKKDNWINSQKIELTIYSRKFAIEKFLNHVKANSSEYPRWKLKFSKWNDQLQPIEFREKLKEAEIVLIPSDAKDPRKFGASHNRLVDAIRSGCIVVASPLKSYLN